MIRSDQNRNHYRRWLLGLVLLVGCPMGTAGAQGVLARAAQRVATLSADVALSRATVIDVSAAGGVTMPYGDLQAGIGTIDLVPGVVVRIHLFLRNTTEATVTMSLPPDSAFVLVDGSGRRLPRVAVRPKEGVSQGTIAVPALERARIDLVFTLDKAVAADAALKIGPSTVLRGIPLRTPDTPPPAPPPTPPTDSVRAPR